MRRLTIAALFAGCASATAADSPPPAGPVSDAETAIKIAKPVCIGDGPQEDRSSNWHATLQGNVWKVEGSTTIVPPACGLPAGYDVEVSAATGTAGTCTETFVLPSLPNNVRAQRCH